MRELFRFALPITLSRVVQTLGLLVGNIFVAQLSMDALAASALATSISLAVFTFASGCLLSLGPVFSRVKQEPSAELNTLFQGFVLATLLGCLIILLFDHVDVLLLLAGQSQVLTTLIQPYFHALSFAVLPMLWTTLIQQYCLSKRSEKALLVHTVFRLILGVGCNYLFIFGLMIGTSSYFAFGFAGLGIGVSVASWIGFLVLLLWVSIRHKLCKSFFSTGFKNWQLNLSLKSFMRLCRTSIPVGMQLALEMVVLMFVTLFIGRFGHAALGAWQVVSQYVLLFTMLPFGVSQAMAILAGKKIKMQQAYQLRYLNNSGILLVLLPALGMGVLYLLFPQQLRDIYLWQHVGVKEALPLLPLFFMLMAVYQCFDGIRLVGIGILRGHLATFRVFVTSLTAFAGGSLLVSAFLTIVWQWEATGIVAGLLTGMIVATGLTYWQQRTVTKKQ